MSVFFRTKYEGDPKATGRIFVSDISGIVPKLLVGYSVFHLADLRSVRARMAADVLRALAITTIPNTIEFTHWGPRDAAAFGDSTMSTGCVMGKVLCGCYVPTCKLLTDEG